MEEKPISFLTPMVRAIQDGRKTQTRRLIKSTDKWVRAFDLPKSKYQLGDILWVKETWARISDWVDVDPDVGLNDGFIYRADWHLAEHPKWRSSRYMPRAAARLFLEVENVRAERLQNISHDDAIAEGTLQWICEEHKSGSYLDNAMRGAACAKPERAFALLWDSIYGKKHPWESNPWVWVIDFRRV